MKPRNLHKTILFILCTICTLLADAAAFAYFFPRTAVRPQIFTDFIIETLAKTATNKSGELHLFYALLLFSVLFFGCLYGFGTFCMLRRQNTLKQDQKTDAKTDGRDGRQTSCLQLFLLTLLPNLCGYVLYHRISYPLLFLSCVCILCIFPCRDYLTDIVILYVFAYYSIVSLATLACRMGIIESVTSQMLYIASVCAGTMPLLLFAVTKRHAMLHAPILVMQLFFPLLLLIYFVDEYVYRSELVKIPYATGYTCFFALLMLVSYSVLLLHIRTVRQKQKQMRRFKDVTYLPLTAFICKITPVLLFIYHSFSAAPMYAQPDQHHHGEQMIPWQQVITLGQSLYDEYTPVSGLFPFLSGGIQHLLLDGTVSDYSPAISITMVLFCIVTMLLVSKHAGTVWAVAFAVCFALPCYNRQYFVLPVLLLLFLPKLLQRPNLWMKVWLLSCFTSGLYYPLFGAALVIGTFPLLARQLIFFFGSGEWKKNRSSVWFYVNWILCLLPVIVSIPLLLRMLRHTLTFSSQTILADGIALWGQTPPDYFLAQLTNQSIRNMLYLTLRFLLPLFGVCAFVFLLYLVLFDRAAEHSQITGKLAGADHRKTAGSAPGKAMENSNKKGVGSRHQYTGKVLRKISNSLAGKITIRNTLLYALTAGAICLLVSYSYTLVRADNSMLLSRTSYILVAVFGMFLPVMVLAYGKEHVPSCLGTLLIACCFSLPMLLYHQTSDLKRPDMWIYPDGESALVMDDGAKIYNHYDVPDSFVRSVDSGLDDQQIKMLGNGFMVSDQLHYISDYAKVMEKCSQVKEDMTYLGLDGQGFYYYLNAKACGTGFIQAAKGFEAQSALLDVIREKRPVVFLLDAESNYYIYYYVMTENYCYEAADQAFYPAELYELLFEKEADDYRSMCPATDFGLTAASFGNSLSTLLPLLTPMSDMENDSVFAPFAGQDYDCMLVQLPAQTAGTLSEIRIQFTFAESVEPDQRTSCDVTCALNGNTLLIPVGMNPCWLLSTITDITISGIDASGAHVSPEKTGATYKLYKIRQNDF